MSKYQKSKIGRLPGNYWRERIVNNRNDGINGMMECWTTRLKTFFQHSNIPSSRMFWLLNALLFALCLPVEAQQPAKIR